MNNYLKSIYIDAIQLYKNDYRNSIDKDSLISEDDLEAQLISIIEEDLEDKEFDNDEIKSIILEDSYNSDLCYKFIAYYLSLYSEIRTIFDLENVINNTSFDKEVFLEYLDIDKLLQHCAQF